MCGARYWDRNSGNCYLRTRKRRRCAPHPIPNGAGVGVSIWGLTRQVVIQGDPQDGWTLVSWDGTPIGPANLPTELFVDLRESYDIWQAPLTLNPMTISQAFETGLDQVGTAITQFPRLGDRRHRRRGAQRNPDVNPDARC
jgi:hypothetical protein